MAEPITAMRTDRLVVLGSKGGPSVHNHDMLPTSLVLELAGQTCVIDCGLGVTRSLVKAGIRLPEIDAIFLTHLHSDHLLELGPLIHTAWATGLVSRIKLFGPPGLRAYWEAFLESMMFDIAIRLEDEKRNNLRDLVELTEFEEGRILFEAIRVDALRVVHPPVTHCYALRFQTEDWRVTFGSDTAYYPPLAEFAAGSDVLVHEALYLPGLEPIIQRAPNAARLREHILASHTPVEDVGRIASQAQVGHLVLNHLVPSGVTDVTEDTWRAAIAPYWNGKVSVARDGLEIKRETV